MTSICSPSLSTDIPATKRSLIKVDQAEDTSSETTMEPPKKKVRFCGVDSCDEGTPSGELLERTPMASSPRELEKLIEKVRKRAERRKRRSMRSPPPPSTEEPVLPKHQKQPNDLAAMQRKLLRMERTIKESARLELELMNQSKKLRDERTCLTRRYESMVQQLREMQRVQQPDCQLFQMGRLPPLMATCRRIPATKSPIAHAAM